MLRRSLLLCATLASASPWYAWGATELSPIAKDNALAFLQALTQRRGGQRLSASELEKMTQPEINKYDKLETDIHGDPNNRIVVIRAWVKGVAPLLGNTEGGFDGPLNKVLDTAEGILGMERIPDQEVHPHHATAVIIKAMKQWTRALKEVHAQMELKSEL